MAGDPKFDAGVEAMRRSAIDRLESWQSGDWTEKPSLTADEVHELINDVADDIRIAVVSETE